MESTPFYIHLLGIHTDKLPLVDVECCATGSLSRGTAAAKKLGWRNQRDEGTS